MLNHIQAVVFDLDNTLVSSSLDFALIREELGCDKSQGILEFIAELPKEQQQQATDRVISHEVSDAHSAYALEGCHDLLQTITDSTLQTAILTRNCREAAKVKIANNKIDVPIVLTREDHPAKPAPDALLHLSELWQIPAENILYVGDYIYDLQIAQNANSKSCLITFDRELEFAHMADLKVKNLPELNEMLTNQIIKN